MRIDCGIENLGRGTNINEIDIPPELEMTVSTGIKWLDEAFGGEGITPSMCTLLSGGPGAGKTTLMLQMANLLTKAGHAVLFNTSEESLFQVRKVTKRLGLHHGFYVGQDVMIPKVLEHADEIKSENPDKRVILILDSSQSHDDGKYKDGGTNSMTGVRIAEAIAGWCKKNFSISFILSQVTKSGVFEGKAKVKHAVDAHAHMYIDQKPSSETFGCRIFKMEKNRFGPSGIGYVLGMDAHKGLYEKGTYEGDSEA